MVIPFKLNLEILIKNVTIVIYHTYDLLIYAEDWLSVSTRHRNV